MAIVIAAVVVVAKKLHERLLVGLEFSDEAFFEAK